MKPSYSSIAGCSRYRPGTSKVTSGGVATRGRALSTSRARRTTGSNLPASARSASTFTHPFGVGAHAPSTNAATLLPSESGPLGESGVGVRQPFQVGQGLDRLLDAYAARAAQRITACDVHLYELCLTGCWYRAAIEGTSDREPPEQALARVRNVLARARAAEARERHREEPPATGSPAE
jgi:hypothetical protein